MSSFSIEQIRGLKDLVVDGVAAGIDASERLQQAITRQPYALLAQVEPIAAPVRMIEQCRQAGTTLVYASLRGANRAGATLAGKIIDRVDAQD
ncbi:MAG TPA: hypothetical protein VL051_15395 [Burkholderiaceae bacterium]|nr:hypothetical protein [Burkholderiaceae bacterium]